MIQIVYINKSLAKKYLSSLPTYPSALGVALEKISEKKEKDMKELQKIGCPVDKGPERNQETQLRRIWENV